MNIKDVVQAIHNTDPQPFPGTRRALACFDFCEGVSVRMLEDNRFLNFKTGIKYALTDINKPVDSFDDFGAAL